MVRPLRFLSRLKNNCRRALWIFFIFCETGQRCEILPPAAKTLLKKGSELPKLLLSDTLIYSINGHRWLLPRSGL